MKRLVLGTVRHALRAIGYALVGGALVSIVVLVFALERRPDLSVWHQARLTEEFDTRSNVESFTEYLALEDRLFDELRRKVYDRVEPEDRRPINRYSHGSLSDPNTWPKNWNRSFHLPVELPRAAALLIHGLSDSPYSMRSIAELLHENDVAVLGLRVPGHGTAPSGLRTAEWEDWAAAVQLAVQHLAQEHRGAPLIVVGYSNGGALAVLHTLEALEDPELILPDRIILLSPEIGISKLAALAVWQERLGRLLGLRKLAWNSIQPEYDPFKYGSFALNAAKQAHLITAEIQSRITRLAKGDALELFPPTLAFQSVADATVTAPALVSGLFDRLPEGGHELVLFDVNRFVPIETIMKHDPDSWIAHMLERTTSSFTVTALRNATKDTTSIAIHRGRRGIDDVEVLPTDLTWPPHVYSLSHVALPFPPDDPVYGGPDAKPSPGIQLGNIALRGEKGVLQISGTDMLRLRWNPFHSYLEERILDVVHDLESKSQ